MIEINEGSIFTIEIVESKPPTIEIIAPSIVAIDVINQNPIVSLQLIEGTNYIANITEGANYSIFVEQAKSPTIEISEKISIKNTTIENTITNNTINNIDNLVVEVACDSSVYVGAAVYLIISNGSVKAFNAIATTPETSNVFGIVESKPSSNICKIRFGGITESIFVNLNLAQEYYLSDLIAGHIVSEDNQPVQIGSVLVKIGQPYSSSRMLYSRGGKLIVENFQQATGAISFGFSGDIGLDSGTRTNNVDVIDNGERFV